METTFILPSSLVNQLLEKSTRENRPVSLLVREAICCYLKSPCVEPHDGDCCLVDLDGQVLVYDALVHDD